MCLSSVRHWLKGYVVWSSSELYEAGMTTFLMGRWYNWCPERSRTMSISQWHKRILSQDWPYPLNHNALCLTQTLEIKIGTQTRPLLLLFLLGIFFLWHLVQGRDLASVVICMHVTIYTHLKNLAQLRFRGRGLRVFACQSGQNTDLKINVNTCLLKAFLLSSC